jgi:hypothetical protein
MISKLEKRLEETAHGKDDLLDLLNIFKSVKSSAVKYLPDVAKTFPHYSRHDLSHIEAIIDSIERILGDERIEALPVGDIWLILVSAYMHDIGMLLSYQEEKDAWESDSFKEYLSSCEKGGDRGLQAAAKAVKDKSGNIHPLLIKNYVTQLTAEYFRKYHHSRSSGVVTGDSPLSKMFSVTVPDNLQNMWECAGNVAKSHGLDFDSLLTAEFDRKNFPIPGYGYYHPRFVAVLLRLGDLCDVQKGRFSEMSIMQFGLLPVKSAQHYYKHKTMDDILIDRENIIMTANINFDEIKSKIPVEQCADDTEREDFCAQVVQQHVNWFSMISAELAKFKWHKDSIFPVDGNFKKDIPDFKPVIKLNDEVMPLSLEDLRFNFPREKAYELIEGYSLYDDPLTFVRELIQNSLDALKMKMWQDITTEDSWIANYIFPDKKENLATLMPFDFTNLQEVYSHYKVEISVDYDREQNRANLIFSDNGIGISKEDFKNKIIQTGASWHGEKYQEKLSRMPPWLRPTGSFGIGLHSVFAVTDRFRIETSTKDESQVIVLNSRRGGGFVFARPDKGKGKTGTRVIIELDADRIKDEKMQASQASPYVKQSDNPVLDIIRKYICGNVICPLFDVGIGARHTPPAAAEPCADDEKIVQKLCDHDIYGKVFDHSIRNYMFDGFIIPDEYKDERYDFAIIGFCPLRFVLWDREQYAFFVFEPELFGRYNSTPKEDRKPYKNITYRGIALRDQSLESLYTISQMNVFSVEFLAGNGKDDIIANRSRLKKEKLSDVRKELMNSAKAAALLGQGLFTAVMQTPLVMNFLNSAEKTAGKLSDDPNDVSCVFTDLKILLDRVTPAAAEQLLYIVFVYRFYLKKNKDALWDAFRNVITKLTDVSNNKISISESFFNIWHDDKYLADLTKLLMRISYKFDEGYNKHPPFSFAYGLGAGFIREIGKMFEHETKEDLTGNNTRISKASLLKNKTFADVIDKYGDEYVYLFCMGFAAGIGEQKSSFGRAFLDRCYNIYDNSYYNNVHIGALGNGFIDTIRVLRTICDKFAEFIEDNDYDSIVNWLYETFFINGYADSSLELLGNDNWTWALWVSVESGLEVKDFFQNTDAYFSALPDFGSGYSFDNCKTVADIINSRQLACKLKNLTDILVDKFPFLWSLPWEKIELRENEFYVRLIRGKTINSLPVATSEKVIQKWWKEYEWNAYPGFEKYVEITVWNTRFFTHQIKDNTVIELPNMIPIIVFPARIENKNRNQFIKEADNTKSAVTGIMECEQTNNIIDYIYLERLREGKDCTKEHIREKYEGMIRDYVIQVKSEEGKVGS